MSDSLFRSVLLLLAMAWAPWGVVRIVDIDRLGWWAVAPQTWTLYVFGLATVTTVFSLVVRAWPAALIGALGVAVLGIPLAGRAIPNEQPAVRDGVPLTVLTLNLDRGQADARSVVDLAHRTHADVVSLAELSRDEFRRLKQAGLDEQYPDAQAVPGYSGSAGLATYSRRGRWDEDMPQVEPAWRRPWLASKLGVPGSGQVRFETLHAAPPRPKTAHQYESQTLLEDLPDPRYKGSPVIIAGDFNATLDNWRLRRLLARGYRDAAEQVGKGLVPTWTGVHGFAALTIDHVLVPRQIGVRSVSVIPVAGTDHRAVVARLFIPGTTQRGSANRR